MGHIDLDGHTFFQDRRENRELANTLAVVVDLDAAVISVGAPGDRHREELVFDDVAVQRALTRVVDAMRRHAYRKRKVQPVPKPRPLECDLCEGRQTIRNPWSGEVFRCPACR